MTLTSDQHCTIQNPFKIHHDFRRRMRIRFLLLVLLGGSSIVHPLAAQTSASALRQFVEVGMKNSPLLLDVSNQAGAMALDSARIRAGYRPQVGFDALVNAAPYDKHIGYDVNVTNGGGLSALVGVRQQIVGHNNLQNQFDAVHLQQRALGVQRGISEQELKRTITGQYITAYGDLQVLAVDQAILQRLRAQQELLKGLVEQGGFKQTDYLVFLTTLNQQTLQVDRTELRYRNDLSALRWTCGMRDTLRVVLSDPALLPATIPSAEVSSFRQRFTLDSLLFDVQDRQIDLAYRPKLSLMGDAGYNTSQIAAAFQHWGFSVGAGFNVPIYDGRLRKVQHDRIAIARHTNAAYRLFFDGQFDQRVGQLNDQLRGLDAQLIKSQEQVRFAEELIAAQHALLDTGQLSAADLLIALNTETQARLAVAQLTVDRYAVINELNYWAW